VKERPTAISSGATCGFNDLKHPIAATYGAFLRTLNKYLNINAHLFYN
jgi:hypothetical protein